MKAIVAHAANNVIGINNTLPWHIPEDLKFFKKYTLDNPEILMGSNTYRSLGRDTLPGRTINVLSRHIEDSDFYSVFRSLESVLASPKKEQIVIAGGAQIYEMFMPYIDEILVTEVFKDVPGDAFFPPYKCDFKKIEVVEETSMFSIGRWVRRSV